MKGAKVAIIFVLGICTALLGAFINLVLINIFFFGMLPGTSLYMKLLCTLAGMAAIAQFWYWHFIIGWVIYGLDRWIFGPSNKQRKRSK